MLSFLEKWKQVGEFKARERRKWMRNTPLASKLAALKALLSVYWPVPREQDPLGPYSYEKRLEAARRARAKGARPGGPRRSR